MANYKLDGLEPVLQNEKYALYKLGQVNDKGVYKGVRLEKATGKQVEVAISMVPKPHVVELMLNGYIQKIH
ncbi:hypothetical protein J6W34_00150 [bacterium]|nr:hypothetical protein [bacterium]